MPASLFVRRVRRFALPLIGAVLALAFTLSALARQSPQELRRQADSYWNEKSYKLAEETYAKLLAADPKLADRAEIELRILVGKIQSEQWDAAVADAETFPKRWPDTRQEARAQVWRGRLYVRVPHQGYRVGKAEFRSGNVPKSAGGAAPVYTDFSALDNQKIAQAWRRAKELFQKFRKNKPVNDDDLNEEIYLNFDLANRAESQYTLYNPLHALYSDWDNDPKTDAPFDAPAAKLAMFCYEQIPYLDGLRSRSDGHSVVLAALGKAGFILRMRQYGAQPYYYPTRYDRRGRPVSGYWSVPPPYVALDPIQILQDVLDKYPNDREADRVAYTLATWTETKGDVMEALRLYHLVPGKYPGSRYVSDANAQIQSLTLPNLSLNAALNLPGRPARFTVSGRNVKQVRFTAYKVTLENVYGKGEYRPQNDSRLFYPRFSDFDRHFNAAQRDAVHRHKFAEWTLQTSDTGRHNQFGDSVSSPLNQAGAYLVEAAGGERDETKTSTLIIVSDLAIVQKVDRDSVLVYAANAGTGRPAQGVKVLVWSPVHNYSNEGHYNEDEDAQYLPGTTGSDGQCRLKLPASADVSQYTMTYRKAETFAIGTAGRYAVTTQSEFRSYQLHDTDPFRQGWIQTDRPLYRPAQVVNYRAILSEGLPEVYRPAAGAKALIEIRGPKGPLKTEDVTLDANGGHSGSFTLAANADLGDYSVLMTVGRNQQITTPFRVEEYKKPEYTVSVQPEKTQARTGETVKATIAARYYFGAPVMRAKAHYRVLRSYHITPRPFPAKLDWYEDDVQNGYGAYSRYDSAAQTYNQLYQNARAAVAEGDIVTDAKGEAQITFSTRPPKPPKGVRYPANYQPDENFTITADVVDDSRREVSGMGSLTATATEFHAYLRLDRQFVTMGDTLQITAKTRDGSDKPFSAGGYVHFIRLIPAIPERKIKDPKTGKWKIVQPYVPPREEPDGSLFIQTDAAKDGTGLAFWNPDKTGEYRLDYRAKDKYGNAITASDSVTVYGQDYDSRLPKNDERFTLLTEKTIYAPGETARVLVTAPMPDSYVLLTVNATGQMRQTRTVFIAGRSAIVNVPVSPDMVPNVNLDATCVYRGRTQTTQAAFGVPAQDRILTLAVAPDKPQYKPGETATFHITAKDAEGRPVKGHFSLAVVDKSLLAIQPDLTPDIRAQFYGFRIQTEVGGADSIYYNAGSAITNPPQISYDRHTLIYPEGMGWLRETLSEWQNQIPGYVAFNAANFEPFYKHGSSVFRNVMNYNRNIGGGFGGGRALNGLSYGDSANSFALDATGSLASARKAPGSRARSEMTANGPAGPLGVMDRLDAPAAAPMDSAPLVEAVVRQKFLDTAYWTPSVDTDAGGNATVSFPFPDNITDWDVKTAGYTDGLKVGLASASVVVKKNLLARLQAPRFFVERDTVTVSANIHNYLSREKNVRVELVIDGELMAFAAGASNPAVRTMKVGKDDEIRQDWTLQILHGGMAKIKVIAQTDEESDAAEMTFPVLVHGVEKFIATSGVIHDSGTQTVTLDIPAQRRKGATRLDVQLQPSLAATVIDALPYLEDYPYGCLEQTLSRFVPTVLTAQALKHAGVNLEDLGKRAAALEEQRRNIPPQQVYENSGYTYPKGVPGVLQTAELASRLPYPTARRSHAPIFDSAVLKQMTDEGLQRLEKLQRPSGGFGWWEGSDSEDPYLSAYAADSLLKARSAGVAVKPEMVSRVLSYLAARVETMEDLNLRAYYVYVLTQNEYLKPDSLAFLYERRERLTAYGQALLAIALKNAGQAEQAQVLLRNLVTTAVIDRERGTAHWESKDPQYWHWYNDKQETTAMVLRALVAILPQGQVAPHNGGQGAQTALAAQTVRWLVDNRRGSVWTSTRQTANVVEALLEYAQTTNELAPDYDATVDVDGKVSRTFHIAKENALFFDNRFLVGDEILGDGAQKLNITMKGKGTLYYSSYLSYFDLQEPIKGVANAIGVERKYYKITPKVAKNKGGEYVTTNERTPLSDGANLVSGDIIEVELYLKSDNDYDYLVYEDMKPAGCEAVETRSGTAYGDGLCSNFELRDTKVAFFVDHLKQGTSRITYKLRAEIPGSFHALPTNAYAFYTPDIRALSDEWRVTITDAPPANPVSGKGKRGQKKN